MHAFSSSILLLTRHCGQSVSGAGCHALGNGAATESGQDVARVVTTFVAQQPTSSGDGWLGQISGDPVECGQPVAALLELPCEALRQCCTSCAK